MAAGTRAKTGDLVLVWPKGRRGVFLPARVTHASGTGFVRRVVLADGSEMRWRAIVYLERIGPSDGAALDRLASEYDNPEAAREACSLYYD